MIHYYYSSKFTLGFIFHVVPSVGFDKCVMTYIHPYNTIKNSSLPWKSPLLFVLSPLPSEPLRTTDFFFSFSIFLFSVFLMLQHLGPRWTRKDCLSQSRPVLRDGKWFPCQHTSSMEWIQSPNPLFCLALTLQETDSDPKPPFLSGSYASGDRLVSHNYSRYWTPGDGPTPQSPLWRLELASPKLLALT